MDLQSKLPTAANAVPASTATDTIVTNAEQYLKMLLKPLIADALVEALSRIMKPEVSNQPEEKLLTVKEAAAFMKVSTSTIHNWKREGRIPFHSIGRRIVFKPKELVATLQSCSDF